MPVPVMAGNMTSSVNATSSGTSLEIKVYVGLFVISGIVALLIIISNTFTIAVILRTRSLRTVTGYMMVSLAIADLGVGLTTAIPLIYAVFSNFLTRAVCDVIGFLSSVSWVVSVYTLTLLSLDRYIAISRPLHYKQLVTIERTLAASVGTWLFAALLWFFPLVGLGSYKYNDEEATCYFHVTRWPVQWITYTFVIFLPTTLTIAFCYGAIWRISRKQRRQLEKTMNEDGIKASRRNFKALRTLMIIVGTFYLAWLPFIVEHIVKAIVGKLEHIPEWLEIAIYVIAVSNSFWNPIVYMGTNKTFRVGAIRVLAACCPCCTGLNRIYPVTLEGSMEATETRST